MKKLLLIIHLFLTFSAFAQMPTQGLIGYWPFNGNSLDESGNGHHAINAGKSTVNYTSDRFGVANAAYSADSTYLKIPYSTAFDFKSGDKFSISTWAFYAKNIYYGGELFYKGLLKSKDESLAGTYGVIFHVSDVSIYYIQPSAIFGNHQFIRDNWCHIVYVYDGEFVSTFINGIIDLKVKANITQSPYDIIIGRMQYQVGKVDDIAMYNRALTTDEISKLYNVTATAVDEGTAVNNLVQISADNVGNYVITSKAEIENVKVYNIKGSLIKETTNKNIGSLSAGIYIFYIDTKQGAVKSKLLVK